jgi:hypothetical protein
MSGHWIGLLTVGALCGVKFIPGAAICIVCGMDAQEQFILTFTGGSLGIIFFTFFGSAVGRLWRRIFPKKDPDPYKGPSFAQRMWLKYGLVGTALLTPPILSPPIGTAIALSFGTPRSKIILFHVASMLLWAILFAVLGHSTLHLLNALGMKSPDCGILG